MSSVSRAVAEGTGGRLRQASPAPRPGGASSASTERRTGVIPRTACGCGHPARAPRRPRRGGPGPGRAPRPTRSPAPPRPRPRRRGQHVPHRGRGSRRPSSPAGAVTPAATSARAAASSAPSHASAAGSIGSRGRTQQPPGLVGRERRQAPVPRDRRGSRGTPPRRSSWAPAWWRARSDPSRNAVQRHREGPVHHAPCRPPPRPSPGKGASRGSTDA